MSLPCVVSSRAASSATVRLNPDWFGPDTRDTVDMATTERLLALLSALQSGRELTGPDLAARLGVTERTIRRDVDHLRGLGYAVEARRGAAGGYLLGSGGTAVPPLMLDREESVALAVCVRAAAGDSVRGVADAAGRALGKLRQTLPPPARAEADALATATLRLSSHGAAVDHDVLVTVSTACRTPERLQMRYTSAAGDVTERRIEPYRVVNVDRRWYLVAHDLDRRAWRTFRLDRMSEVLRTGHGVVFSNPPDPAQYVRESITMAPYRHRATVVVDGPIEVVAERIPASVGMLEELGPSRTRVRAGADDLEYLVIHLGAIGFDITVEEPAALRDAMRDVGERLLRAARVSEPG
jgi:predicted DNA-binding transcriptional regulator YafY